MLATLDMTRKEAKTMRENMKTTHVKYEAAKQKTASLLNLLTGKATVSIQHGFLFTCQFQKKGNTWLDGKSAYIIPESQDTLQLYPQLWLVSILANGVH